MIYYVCKDDKRPSGGRRISYRHVDVLNDNGIDAAIMHSTPGFRLTWFPNETKVMAASSTILKDDDILVYPETRGPDIYDIALDHKYVIFNQNAYYTFMHYQGNERLTPYHHPNLLGLMCVSEDNRDFLSFTFPHLDKVGKLKRVHISYDHDLFQHVPLKNKKRQVAFMQRKHAKEVFDVINILKLRSVLDWTFVLIDNIPAQEVAQIMKESAVFLEFGYPAGCPVPPLEALACGCHVIGYTGFGGDEYQKIVRGFSAIRHNDICGFAKEIERICQWFDQAWANEHMMRFAEEQSLKDAEIIHSIYNKEAEEKDVLMFWKGIL